MLPFHENTSLSFHETPPYHVTGSCQSFFGETPRYHPRWGMLHSPPPVYFFFQFFPFCHSFCPLVVIGSRKNSLFFHVVLFYETSRCIFIIPDPLCSIPSLVCIISCCVFVRVIPFVPRAFTVRETARFVSRKTSLSFHKAPAYRFTKRLVLISRTVVHCHRTSATR